MPAFFRLRLVFGLFFLTGLGSVALAADGPNSFTLDLPFGPSEATPAWLGHPVLPPTSFASLDLPIAPPSPDASLLVTVFFQEKAGGFMRISWQGSDSVLDTPGAQGAQVLSDNFYDGIGMSNQRSLLVTPQTMKNPGSLNFQCGDAALGIQRIQLEWLENQTGVTSPAITDVLVTSANGKTTLGANLGGQPQPADTPAWKDRIVNVPMTDAPLRIEEGVEFSVQLDSLPATARLAVTEAGLPWNQHLAVWINGKLAGTMAPTVPDLGDGGYAATNKAAVAYVGWRDGTLFVPVTSLIAGENTVQFSAESDTSMPVESGDSTPLAVKNVAFQFDYPAAPAAATATSSNPAPVATSPTSPDTAPAPDVTPAPSPGRSDLLSLPTTDTTP